MPALNGHRSSECTMWCKFTLVFIYTGLCILVCDFSMATQRIVYILGLSGISVLGQQSFSEKYSWLIEALMGGFMKHKFSVDASKTLWISHFVRMQVTATLVIIARETILDMTAKLLLSVFRWFAKLVADLWYASFLWHICHSFFWGCLCKFWNYFRSLTSLTSC